MNISKKNNETWYHGQIKNLKISLVLFENENYNFVTFFRILFLWVTFLPKLF